MSVRLLSGCAVTALLLAACSTTKNNPIYQQSTQYKGSSPYASTTSSHVPAHTHAPTSSQTSSQAHTQTYTQPQTTYASTTTSTPYVSSASAQTVRYVDPAVQTQSALPVVYQSEHVPYDKGTTTYTQASHTQASHTTGATSYTQANYDTGSAAYTRVNHECLNKETKRELIGGVIGGGAGALAGRELIGGTKGTVIGAAVGGLAGYGIGDKSINCDPIPVQASHTQPYVTQPYSQSTTPAHYTGHSAPAPQPAYPATTYQAPSISTQPTYTASTQPSYTQPAIPAQPTYAAPTIPAQPSYTAPTDQAYGDTYGTPGYHAVMAAQGAPATVQAPAPTQTAQVQAPAYPQAAYPQPTYAAPQPTYAAPQPSYAAPQQSYAPPASMTTVSTPSPQPYYQSQGAGSHVVVEGDTVYSMSKRLCVGVDDIQRLNRLDGAFKIRLGDTIQLPASRCAP